MGSRAQSPVFIVGCHRSGTALLYDSLLDAGGFPIYRYTPFIHNTLLAVTGNPANRRNRKKMANIWLRSEAFRRTGLDREETRERIMNDCRSGSDLLRLTMEELARRDGVDRWLVHDPDCILHIPQIKKEIPEALFVHIVRDGRDTALSLHRQHPSIPLGWSRKNPLLVWALLWEWTVKKGRRYGQQIPADYLEISFEDLVQEPEKTYAGLGEFLEHNIDYARIGRNASGRTVAPNTVWKEEVSENSFSPVGRWKTKLSPSEIAVIEGLIGDSLKQFGYSLWADERAPNDAAVKLPAKVHLMGAFYPRFFGTKLFLRNKTLVGRLSRTTEFRLDPS